MELIPTMEAYETVYHIISEDILQGSHICRRLEELCERENLVCHEKKGEMLADYISYVYMQKKWDKYRKSLKTKELPKWEDVMSKIVTFVSPEGNVYLNTFMLFTAISIVPEPSNFIIGFEISNPLFVTSIDFCVETLNSALASFFKYL